MSILLFLWFRCSEFMADFSFFFANFSLNVLFVGKGFVKKTKWKTCTWYKYVLGLPIRIQCNFAVKNEYYKIFVIAIYAFRYFYLEISWPSFHSICIEKTLTPVRKILLKITAWIIMYVHGWTNIVLKKGTLFRILSLSTPVGIWKPSMFRSPC